MKRTEVSKLRDKSADELNGIVGELRDAMLKARIARSMEGKQAGMQYRAMRRQIARIQTLIGQKAAQPGQPAAKKKTGQPAAKKA